MLSTDKTIIKQASCTDSKQTDVIDFKTAQNAILNAITPLQAHEYIPITRAKSRILAKNIISPINVPSHTNSAMDGYAIHHSDLPKQGATKTLKIFGTVLAGQTLSGACPKGYCVRIMTGAPIPTHLDTVIMQEHCKQLADEQIQINHQHKKGQNVRLVGEDILQGNTVLPTGKFLCPADIGLIASLGFSHVYVKRKLRIAIASTGDEVHDIATPKKPHGIYDSNRYSLLAALDRPDIDIINLGIIADDKSSLLNCFNQTAKIADIIISSGGVSVGAADFTKSILETDGKINFWKVAIKPGRPLAFGHFKNCLFFGLPGNPVATLVSFYQFVLPALDQYLGTTNRPIAPILKARCTQTIIKKPGRTEIQRGLVTQAKNGILNVTNTGQQGSGILTSISNANAFIILEHDRTRIHNGEWVDIQLFSGLI